MLRQEMAGEVSGGYLIERAICIGGTHVVTCIPGPCRGTSKRYYYQHSELYHIVRLIANCCFVSL